MDTRSTSVPAPFFAVLAVVGAVAACTADTDSSSDDIQSSGTSSLVGGTPMLPSGDVEKVDVAAVGDKTNFFRDVDDGLSSSSSDGDKTTVRNRSKANDGSYTASYSGGPAGTVSDAEVHYRGRHESGTAGTFTVSLYDGTTLLAKGTAREAQGSYTDYVETFSGLSVANANNLRTRVDFHRTSGSGNLNLTQIWLVAATATTSTSTSTGTSTGTDAGTSTGSTTPTAPSSSYVDDTFSSATGTDGAVAITGDHGYTAYSYGVSADGKSTALDARSGSFVLANSMNDNPTLAYDCTQGTLPVNLYPFSIKNADYTAVVGGIWNGLVPQQSDWEPTYCNSAGIYFKGAPNGAVDGVRLHATWDAIRNSDGSPGLTLKDSWISGVRDDALENDYLYSVTVKDTLIDGAFQLFSNKMSSTSTATDGSANTVAISGGVFRLQSYLYKGVIKYGALFKTMPSMAPKHTVRDTVLAVDPGTGVNLSTDNWTYTWADMTSCSNNVFLWMSDTAIPSAIGNIPACFTIVKGQAAIDMWNKAKKNWIDCHPKLARHAGDPASDPTQCVPNTYGGYSN